MPPAAPSPSNEDDAALRAQCLGLAIDFNENQSRIKGFSPTPVSDAGLIALADKIFGYIKNGKVEE
ncbi:hypothetical protein Barb6_01961 [Bacteroidales bacterium Barb6]|nr:hypothetical protein Barb6_01961 [Bacteroidales bacterium Barb6]